MRLDQKFRKQRHGEVLSSIHKHRLERSNENARDELTSFLPNMNSSKRLYATLKYKISGIFYLNLSVHQLFVIFVTHPINKFVNELLYC